MNDVALIGCVTAQNSELDVVLVVAAGRVRVHLWQLVGATGPRKVYSVTRPVVLCKVASAVREHDVAVLITHL